MKNNKKKGILTFLFSLLPGAGEMYMGLMKQGVSLMTMFFGSIAICSLLGTDILAFVGVIIWCYSFFHVHNLCSLSEEEFQQVEDKLLIPFMGEDIQLQISNQKIRTVGAVLMIFFGASLLWNYVMDILVRVLPENIRYMIGELFYDLPDAIVSVFIIWLGVHLIKGKKKVLDAEEVKETV